MTGLDEDQGCLSIYPLRTDRLLLRPLAPHHGPGLVPLANDEAVSRYTARLPFPYGPSDAEAFIQDAARCHHSGSGLVLAIERRGDGAVLGVCSVERTPNATTWDLGYWLGRAHWGQGFATEALRTLADHAFTDLGAERLTAKVAPENTASARVLEKLGFTGTGAVPCLTPARDTATRPAEGFAVDAETFATATARPLVLVSAVVLLDVDNRVLLQQRPAGKDMAGLWEFPGGKVHDGETPERALIRELHEELGIDVRESCLAPLTFASHAYPRFHLLMPVYVCRQWKGKLQAREGQTLAWVRPNALKDYPMPPADIPLVPVIRDWV